MHLRLDSPQTPVVKAAEDQVWANVEGETMVLNLRTGIYFSLHGIGRRIWRLIQNPVPLPILVDAVADECEVGVETIQREVVRFIDEMHEAGLVELTPTLHD